MDKLRAASAEEGANLSLEISDLRCQMRELVRQKHNKAHKTISENFTNYHKNEDEIIEASLICQSTFDSSNTLIFKLTFF